MRQDEFYSLFLEALEIAARNTEAKYLIKIPRNFEIEFHGEASLNGTIDVDTAFNEMYLGESLYHRIIDVGVLRIKDDKTIIYLR